MAKYTVTHSCGHTQVHQLFGKHSGFGGRDSKLEWLETQICTDCWKQQQQSDREQRIKEENERSAQLASENHLPQLVGSEKQIGWATSIRQQMIDSLESFVSGCGHADEWKAKFDSMREAFKVIVLSNTDCRWFIDHRDFGTVRVAFGKQLVDWIKINHPEVMSK